MPGTIRHLENETVLLVTRYIDQLLARIPDWKAYRSRSQSDPIIAEPHVSPKVLHLVPLPEN